MQEGLHREMQLLSLGTLVLFYVTVYVIIPFMYFYVFDIMSVVIKSVPLILLFCYIVFN